MGYSMRTERYRYTEWRERKSGKILARELYDHVKDNAENVNVADEAKYAEIVKQLSQMLKRGWREAKGVGMQNSKSKAARLNHTPQYS